MDLNFIDRLDRAPTGDFHLEVFRKGRLIEIIDEKNLIVDNSKLIHARMLGGDVTNRSVTQFGVGTNGTTPVGGNTALTGAYIKSTDSTTYPGTNTQVVFAFSLGTSEANGMAISEFGLLTTGGMLYARKVRALPLNKDTDLTLSGSWTINF